MFMLLRVNTVKDSEDYAENCVFYPANCAPCLNTSWITWKLQLPYSARRIYLLNFFVVQAHHKISSWLMVHPLTVEPCWPCRVIPVLGGSVLASMKLSYGPRIQIQNID